MKIPDSISHRWIATLDNDQLVTAEAELHLAFSAAEKTEKARTGGQYMLLQGPATLVNAWQRWTMLRNETQSRGIVVQRRA